MGLGLVIGLWQEVMVIGWGVSLGIFVQALIVFVLGLFIIRLFTVHFQYLTIQLVI